VATMLIEARMPQIGSAILRPPLDWQLATTYGLGV